MMDRSPRAPVLRSSAFLAMAPIASAATVRWTPSISNSRWYCFTSAFLGWVRMSRDFAAWLGLTPLQRSTGGKRKLREVLRSAKWVVEPGRARCGVFETRFGAIACPSGRGEGDFLLVERGFVTHHGILRQRILFGRHLRTESHLLSTSRRWIRFRSSGKSHAHRVELRQQYP